MIICGIDPGVAIVGFGFIEKDGVKHKSLRHGVIRTPSDLSLEKRLLQIRGDLCQLFDMYEPRVLAVEELFFNTNVTTGINVAHARGVILLTAAERGIPVFSYSPQQVKQAVVGYGKAEKQQVMEMTRVLLNLPRVPRPDDAADALAVALCHSQASHSILKQL
ncbi:MAG: crossover junction endodeoxyribonuclease RuvC [Oscillospiraceae bacterium]|nr:crossover junction endodeoxyribonuclease RuvC [Oscillospiraceae bacterium]